MSPVLTLELGVVVFCSWRKRVVSASGTKAARANRLAFEPLEPRQMLDAGPVVSEFMAINNSTWADEDGEFSDWI